MPNHRVPDDVKRMHGTYRKTPDPRSRERRVVRTFHSDDELTDAQKTLIEMMPAEFDVVAQDCYLAAARGAPWLQAMDHGALVALATAISMHITASRMLEECMQRPEFSTDPNSEAARAGKLYARIISRQADNIISWSRALGLSPRGRADLGITLDPPVAARAP